MQILILSPITTKDFFDLEAVVRLLRAEEAPGPRQGRRPTHKLRPETRLSHTTLARGPAAIESEADEKAALPEILAELKRAEAGGVDAVVINCMGDPGVAEGRATVNIPVIGPAEVSMQLAARLCGRFSIVTILDSVIEPLKKLAKRYGVVKKLASVRAIGMHVLDLKKNRREMMARLTQESLHAIEKDGAEGIILGCTGMVGCAAELRQALKKRGYAGVPVIDPLIAAIRAVDNG